MKQVTKQQFFQAIGHGDIVSRAEGMSYQERGIYSIFQSRSGTEVGRIYEKPIKEYLLTDQFYQNCFTEKGRAL
jgi:hypothetical protein